MKKIITLFLGLSFAFNVSAQNDTILHEKHDTTVLTWKNKKIIIVDPDKEGDTITIETKEDDVSLVVSLDIGASGYLTPANNIVLPADQRLMELDYAKSRDFSWNFMVHGLDFANKRLYFAPGFGLQWSGYRFKENNLNISSSNDTTAFYTVNQSYNKYKLRATYFQVPVLFGVRLGNVEKDYGFQFGVIGGYRIGSMIKEKFDVEGKSFKNKTKDDFNLLPFKASVTARLRFNFFSIYANYSLTPLFENGKAPELYPFSVGVTFGSI